MDVSLLLTARGTTLVHLGGNGVGDGAKLLLLLLEVLSGGLGTVLLEPLGGLLDSVQKLLWS